MNLPSKIKSILLITICLTILSCETNVEEETPIDENGNPISENESCDPDISFSTSIKAIIDTNCISCHGGNQFPDLRTYEGISANASNVKEQVVSRRMPLNGSLTSEEIELIRCWIDNGALNN
ncbi:c-type cytochrome [Aquimarina algiphila]|uniref:c-type cytochrome n=1 Tax=Aquimarina algiphila TaxID=2047982 RepID=UPI002493C547|nr:cytochrome c [Aquimarina algiphila]